MPEPQASGSLSRRGAAAIYACIGFGAGLVIAVLEMIARAG